MEKKLFINLGRCIACRACEVACEKEHGISFITVYEFRDIAVPLNCRHCEKAPCIEVCPTKAIYRDEDGAVVIDGSKCIGCYMCSAVCPYAIPIVDPIKELAVKCDLCAERRKEGKGPFCAAVCPTDAIIYADLNELMEEKRRRKAEHIVEAQRKAVETLAYFG
ncbi:4Fe-4S dicluster domain-containing protein [Thermococcus sp. GR6]|uniref:4Fe-4S dicluster domain-containing protein n=1 Tax=Thermococcus sp. GR6 TaxID=1638256 RepID=UPI0014317B31|nr:4Fe-4S dicluster domain-containing protein [Thermococcus sp. GR6]NJE42247.1 4Fe-4S dicluster domain-containing protein [Thermococcus sp. GR6]